MTATNEPRLTREKIKEIFDQHLNFKYDGAEWQVIRPLCRLALIGLATETSGVVEALEFYSDESNDVDDDEMHGGYWIGHCDDTSNPVRRFIKDAGDKARSALAKFKEAMEK